MNFDTSECSICKKNRATHICEDCGAVLCLDCLESHETTYYFCTDCHHTLGTPQPGETFETCPECGSTHLSRGKRSENLCPRCHSSHIAVIEERRRELAQQLRHAIMAIHYGHTRLREVTGQLLSAKQMLVSLRMTNFLHYKWLEERLEKCHDDLVASKTRVGNQVEMLAKRLAAETKGLMDYQSWAPSQFPFIEGVSNRVMELCRQYKRTVDEMLDPIRRSLKDITRQIDGLNYYRDQFRGFFDYAELAVGELPVCAFPKIRIVGSDFLRNDKALGNLYITNRRLVFIAETGRVRKRTDVVFEFPLAYFTGFEEEGRFRKRTIMRFKQGIIRLHCSEQTLKVMPDFIEIARTFDRYVQIDLQRVRRLEQRTLNVDDLRIKIDELTHNLLARQSRPVMTRPVMSDYGTHHGIMAHGAFAVPPSQNHPPYRHTDGIVPPRTRPFYRTPDYGSRRSDHGPHAQMNGRDGNQMEDIVRALNETIRLFREGRIVPADFTRRHRILMRDLYELRSRLSGMDSAAQYNL